MYQLNINNKRYVYVKTELLKSVACPIKVLVG